MVNEGVNWSEFRIVDLIISVKNENISGGLFGK